MGSGPAKTLLIRLEPCAQGGLQQQVYAGVRRAILDGVVAPGARLPSSRALALDLGVSRTTTLLAVEQLLAEGYLEALDLFPVRIWSEIAGRCVRAVSASQLDYGDPAGIRPLCEAIADHVRTVRDTRCDADQVFVVAGAQRGMEWVSGLLRDHGDVAWLEEPCFPGMRKALISAGARIVPVGVDAEGLDVAAGARSHARRGSPVSRRRTSSRSAFP